MVVAVVAGIVTVTTGGVVSCVVGTEPSGFRIVKICGSLLNTPFGVTALTVSVQSPGNGERNALSAGTTPTPGSVSGTGCVIVPTRLVRRRGQHDLESGQIALGGVDFDPHPRQADHVAGELHGDVEVGLG